MKSKIRGNEKLFAFQEHNKSILKLNEKHTFLPEFVQDARQSLSKKMSIQLK
jgi:hypothetical protein